MKPLQNVVGGLAQDVRVLKRTLEEKERSIKGNGNND